MSIENQIFNGIKFYKRADNNYWYSTTTINGKRVYMHKYVWEFYNSPIEKGYEIHHIDLNRDNNKIENLELMSSIEHRALHAKLNKANEETVKKWRGNLQKAQEKAKEWHKSEEGKEWHKKHYGKFKENLHQKAEYVCINCGNKFITTKGKNFFCSNKCKSAYRRKSGIDNEIRICAVCGAEFTINKYSKTKTCSRSCARKLVSMGSVL